jgi:Kef-type K+ transport system membrane component KefB
MVMQAVNETKFQYMQLGMVYLAILLLQDFVVVSLLDIVPILGGTGADYTRCFNLEIECSFTPDY